MLTGEGLPALFRKTLMAQAPAVKQYLEMAQSEEFQNPISYEQIDPKQFDALFLPGGHDKGMREYLESTVLQTNIAQFFDSNKAVGAICHGTLAAARTISQSSDPDLRGKSVLWGKKTTGLTRNQELVAYKLTVLKLGDYYRTYSIPMADEVKSFLRQPSDFLTGPGMPIPLERDSDQNLKAGFTVRDGKYLSARWPGDAHRFAYDFVAMLEQD